MNFVFLFYLCIVLIYYVMKMIPKFYNSIHEKDVVKLTTRSDKKGDVFHCVEFVHPRFGDMYMTFEKLSSALDFIQSNFKAKF